MLYTTKIIGTGLATRGLIGTELVAVGSIGVATGIGITSKCHYSSHGSNIKHTILPKGASLLEGDFSHLTSPSSLSRITLIAFMKSLSIPFEIAILQDGGVVSFVEFNWPKDLDPSYLDYICDSLHNIFISSSYDLQNIGLVIRQPGQDNACELFPPKGGK